jgi:hypothetical protein
MAGGGGKKRYVHRVLVGELKESENLYDLGVDGRITLK